MFRLQKTRSAVPVAEVQTGKKRLPMQCVTGKSGKRHLTFSPHLLHVKVSDRAERLGSGLLHRGLKPNADTFIGIFAQNRPEVSVDTGV